MKNNICSALYKAKTLKDIEEIRWKEYTQIVHEWSGLFETYFREECKKWLKYVEENPMLFEKISDENIFIEKWFFENFLQGVQNFLKKWYELGRNFLFRQIQVELPKNGDIFVKDSYSIEYAKTRAGDLIKDIDETSKRRMQTLIAEALEKNFSKKEMRDAIMREFGEYGKVRATLIAQQETAMAHEYAQDKEFREIADEMGLVGWKRSHSQGDGKVRATHRQNELDGWIENNILFSGTGTMYAPHGFRCRCVTMRRLIEPSIDEKLGVYFEKINFSATDGQKATIFESIKQVYKRFPFIPKLKDIYDIFDEWVLMHYHNIKHAFWWNQKSIEDFDNMIVFVNDSDAQKWRFWTIASASENKDEYIRAIIYHEFGHAIFKDTYQNNPVLFSQIISISRESLFLKNKWENKGTKYPLHALMKNWIDIAISEEFSESISAYMMWKYDYITPTMKNFLDSNF